MTPIDIPVKGPVAPVEKVDPATLSKFQQLCLKSQPLMLYVVSLAQFLDIGMFFPLPPLPQKHFCFCSSTALTPLSTKQMNGGCLLSIYPPLSTRSNNHM